MFPEAAEFIRALRAAPDPAQLRGYCDEIRQRLVATHLVVHVRIARQLGLIQLFSSFPEVSRYDFEGIWSNPYALWPHLVRTKMEPIFWDEADIFQQYLPDPPANSYAITLPVHDPTGELVVMTAWIDNRHNNNSHNDQVVNSLLIAGMAMLRALTQMSAQQQPESRRQLVALYALAGYPIKLIAKYTGVSTRSVHRYLAGITSEWHKSGQI